MNSLLDLITPTNLESERNAFFDSNSYNPTFHYIWQDADFDPKFVSILKYPLWEAIKLQDHEAIVRAASKLFEVDINGEMIDRAAIIAQLGGEPAIGSASEVKELFDEAFAEFSIDYTAKISPRTGFNVRPNHREKILLISDQAHFEYMSMEGLVRHELVHIMRHMNGKYNGISRSPRYLPTEEGLAAWCQDAANDDRGQAQHAMEYLASGVGVGSGLREIFNCCVDMGMSRELAWKRASRHKFGFVKTKLPGDILKPAMYFANELLIEDLSPDEKLRLFVGKIDIDQIEIFPTYTGMWPAKTLSEYFHLSADSFL